MTFTRAIKFPWNEGPLKSKFRGNCGCSFSDDGSLLVSDFDDGDDDDGYESQMGLSSRRGSSGYEIPMNLSSRRGSRQSNSSNHVCKKKKESLMKSKSLERIFVKKSSAEFNPKRRSSGINSLDVNRGYKNDYNYNLSVKKGPVAGKLGVKDLILMWKDSGFFGSKQRLESPLLVQETEQQDIHLGGIS